MLLEISFLFDNIFNFTALNSFFFFFCYTVTFLIFQRVNNSNIRHINSVQAGVKAGEAKIRETCTVMNNLKTASETSIEWLSNLNKTLREIMSKVQNVFDRLSIMNNRDHHRWILNINKVIVSFVHVL